MKFERMWCARVITLGHLEESKGGRIKEFSKELALATMYRLFWCKQEKVWIIKWIRLATAVLEQSSVQEQ